MSLYKNENADNFEDSLKSIFRQTLQPAQVVLVVDGPIGEKLKGVASKYSQLLDIVWLKSNHGLGYALAVGLKHCKYNFVARMDTDDLAISKRMEKQVKFLDKHPDVSVVGGYIAEFEHFPQQNSLIRKVPNDIMKIKTYSKRRNPLNHVTVLFRKKDILAVGSYQPFEGFEDYYLWVRLLAKGYKLANLPEVLVYVRIGNEMIYRRQGTAYFFRDFKFQHHLLVTGYITLPVFFLNFFTRCMVRLLPVKILGRVYKKFARK